MYVKEDPNTILLGICRYKDREAPRESYLPTQAIAPPPEQALVSSLLSERTSESLSSRLLRISRVTWANNTLPFLIFHITGILTTLSLLAGPTGAHGGHRVGHSSGSGRDS